MIEREGLGFSATGIVIHWGPYWRPHCKELGLNPSAPGKPDPRLPDQNQYGTPNRKLQKLLSLQGWAERVDSWGSKFVWSILIPLLLLEMLLLQKSSGSFTFVDTKTLNPPPAAAAFVEGTPSQLQARYQLFHLSVVLPLDLQVKSGSIADHGSSATVQESVYCLLRIANPTCDFSKGID